MTRSYSLCNPVDAPGRYVLGVLRDRGSRGGSRYVHEQLRVGQAVAISPPRNNFKLRSGDAKSVLVAGGIGITPIWSMLQQLVAQGREVELVYCARSRGEAAFAQDIEALADRARITWHFDDEAGGPPDLRALLGGRGKDSHYYCCGPAPMLDSFEGACRSLDCPNAYIERFAAAPLEPAQSTGAFDVVCSKSGKTVGVAPGQSVLDALLQAGLALPHSCKEGICGSCETAVLDCGGGIEHLDGILSPRERESGQTMMICVSRCKGSRIVLDI